MRMKTSHLFVAVVVAAVGLYFLGGSILHAGRPPNVAEAKPAQAARQDAAPAVQIILSLPAQRERRVSLRARTEAARNVVVRAETSGVVARTPAAEGAQVGRGAVLCQLAVDARQAAVDQARAALKAKRLQQQASVELARRGFRSQTQVLQDQANLDAAEAAVRQAEIALQQVNIRAPFAGVFDRREAEIGAYLATGQACGVVIELDPILIVADVPETQAGLLHRGAAAEAALVSGEKLNGRVRYVSRDADPQTRTYRVEVAAANPGLIARSGLSADLRIQAGVGEAHLIPLSALVLDSAGRQGVRHVLPNGFVAFAPVAVQEETAEGVWVSGLAGLTRVITVGQSYVAEGQKVRVAAAR